MKALQGRLSGQILMLATIAMVVLLGFSALAVDVGLLYSTRRRMQTAADGAAIAGATALRDGQNYTKAADDVASFNGFTNSQNNVTVAVNEPTLPSPYPIGGVFGVQATGLYELANKASDRHTRRYNPARHHAKLAANSTVTLCEFLLESLEYQQQRKDRKPGS